jgi:hypothetical protein
MSIRIGSDNYKHTVEIERVRHMSEINNLQTSFDIEL